MPKVRFAYEGRPDDGVADLELSRVPCRGELVLAGPGRMLVVLSVAHTPTQDGLDAIVIVGSSESSFAKLEPRVLALAEQTALAAGASRGVLDARSDTDIFEALAQDAKRSRDE